MVTFVKLNDEPVKIECVEDEHEAANDFKPSFWWWNRRYFLENFTRTHGSPWMGTWIDDPYPEHIHAMEADNYYRPLFIELIGDEFVNIYEERESET